MLEIIENSGFIIIFTHLTENRVNTFTCFGLNCLILKAIITVFTDFKQTSESSINQYC